MYHSVTFRTFSTFYLRIKKSRFISLLLRESYPQCEFPRSCFYWSLNYSSSSRSSSFQMHRLFQSLLARVTFTLSFKVIVFFKSLTITVVPFCILRRSTDSRNLFFSSELYILRLTPLQNFKVLALTDSSIITLYNLVTVVPLN